MENKPDHAPTGVNESPALATTHDHSPPLATDRGAELEAAIARITRALGTADDETIAELVAERKAMRAELESMRRPANVVPISDARREGR